jgi:hypothetical protein
MAAVLGLAALGLSGCGGGSSADPVAESLSSAPASTQPSTPLPARESQAAASDIRATGTERGITPFIAFVDLSGAGITDLAAIEFTISPRDGSVSRPVHVHYAMAALVRAGRVLGPGVAGSWIRLPVFGLYAGVVNQVAVQLDFNDGSAKQLIAPVTTPPYEDPNGIYDHLAILKPRGQGTTLGFDFFVLKSNLGSPVILDSDGAVRWVGAGVSSAFSSALVGDGFVIGGQSAPSVYRLGLDGSLSSEDVLPTPPYINFHHNIDYGKQGLLAELNLDANGVQILESNIIELSSAGLIVNRWDLGAILSAYMSAHGDDPTAFVRPGADWFHSNAATYDPRDDSLIVSSRENFLIKLDYATGDILWILGDPTKYWYTFPSLRAKALTLARGGLYPIGQHAVSITSDGLIMIFNDGAPSFSQPPGAPIGESRTYSAVSAYSIDVASGTAQEVWRFDYGQSIYSYVCSSVYEASGKSLLIDYATADNATQVRLVGLDGTHNVVFDFSYPANGCATSWNAVPIALDDFVIT